MTILPQPEVDAMLARAEAATAILLSDKPHGCAHIHACNEYNDLMQEHFPALCRSHTALQAENTAQAKRIAELEGFAREGAEAQIQKHRSMPGTPCRIPCVCADCENARALLEKPDA